MFNFEDILAKHLEEIKFSELQSIREEKGHWLEEGRWGKFREAFLKLKEFGIETGEFSYSQDVVRIGLGSEVLDKQKAVLQSLVEELVPWRKGPFSLFGIEIDAEWRSDLKWRRVENLIGDLSGKRVLDIGCNNGYYMFRLLEHNPELVLGIDPVERCFLSFSLLQYLAKNSAKAAQLQFELLGVEHVNLFPRFFDLVLSMGILYHHRNPHQQLLDIRDAMRPGGKLIVESIVIPGEESIALSPSGDYARMRNVFFVPTVNCLCSWLEKSKFIDIEVHSVEKTTVEEQRATKYSPFASFKDSLDSDDREKTIEGYPAPLRVVVSCNKREL